MVAAAQAAKGQPGHGQEWPGQAPAAFTDKFTGLPLMRKIVNTECRNGVEYSVARQGLGRYFTDETGLVNNESKKILGCAPSQVYQWKPSKRSLSAPGQYHNERPEGRAHVEGHPQKPYSIREKRHIRQVESKEEYSDRPVGTKPVMRGNGLRAADQPAREVDLSNEMQRKNRALDLRSQRNGIGCKVLGDKAYRHPEYEPGFYKAGQLIVGAGFHRGHYPKTEARNSVNVEIKVRTGKKLRSHKEKEEANETVEAMMEVEQLTAEWEAENPYLAGESGTEKPDTGSWNHWIANKSQATSQVKTKVQAGACHVWDLSAEDQAPILPVGYQDPESDDEKVDPAMNISSTMGKEEEKEARLEKRKEDLLREVERAQDLKKEFEQAQKKI